MFRGRLGEGEVMGLSRFKGSATLRVVIVMPPKDVDGKDERGIRLMGESGEEDGDGSESGDESVVDMVVVGDESADSEACVDVLSWCL
jgi:hypothetical protein